MKVCHKRSRMSNDDRREQLLSAGGELLGRRSYEDVSIDEIARAAGISKGLLYHYFPTKKDFLLAVLQREVEVVTELTAPDPSLSPLEQIDASLGAFLDYADEHVSGFAMLIRTRGGGDPDIRAVLDAARERRVQTVLDGVTAWLPAPADARESVALRSAVQGWIYFVEGVLLRWVDERDLSREQLRDLCRAVLLESLRAAAALDPQLELDAAVA
jgi:AcrR family transcriptional regulator